MLFGQYWQQLSSRHELYDFHSGIISGTKWEDQGLLHSCRPSHQYKPKIVFLLLCNLVFTPNTRLFFLPTKQEKNPVSNEPFCWQLEISIHFFDWQDKSLVLLSWRYILEATEGTQTALEFGLVKGLIKIYIYLRVFGKSAPKFLNSFPPFSLPTMWTRNIPFKS